VEGRAFLERNGYKIGLFGLTAPKNYGAADSIYPADAATKALAEFRDASLNAQEHRPMHPNKPWPLGSQ
jgi:hypothetical protein